jgi:D-tagatose-1,6-bisphosphate aldolase subunit GatZ/KbaZ
VISYDRKKAAGLSMFIVDQPDLVYEAHSTDYQTGPNLKQMVEDHFAFLKVGPWLTFAFREAVFALEAMERELFSGKKGYILSNLQEVLEKTMLAHPKHWEKHYHGNKEALRFARKYSYSDRSRYYWGRKELQKSLETLIANMSHISLPWTLVSQFLPNQYRAIMDGTLGTGPKDLVRHKITEVLEKYREACRL